LAKASTTDLSPPDCGIRLVFGHRFCTNCGKDI
jgi:hypothetical protein